MPRRSGRRNEAYKLDVLWKQSQNGGINARVPWVKMVAAFSGIATAIAMIAVAVIEKG